MYAVVHFDGEDCVECVPVTWLDGSYCYWPMKDAKKKITNMSLADKEKWNKFKVRKLGSSYKDYETARYYCKLAEETSNLEDDDEIRKRKKPARLISDNEREEDSEESEKEDKTCAEGQNIPTPPRGFSGLCLTPKKRQRLSGLSPQKSPLSQQLPLLPQSPSETELPALRKSPRHKKRPITEDKQQSAKNKQQNQQEQQQHKITKGYEIPSSSKVQLQHPPRKQNVCSLSQNMPASGLVTKAMNMSSQIIDFLSHHIVVNPLPRANDSHIIGSLKGISETEVEQDEVDSLVNYLCQTYETLRDYAGQKDLPSLINDLVKFIQANSSKAVQLQQSRNNKAIEESANKTLQKSPQPKPSNVTETEEGMKDILQKILCRLDTIDENVKEIKEHIIITKDLDIDTVDKILESKLKSVEDLENFERKMDDSTRKRLICALASLQGGSDAGDICRTIMRAMMTNYVMSFYSGSGQKGKKAFLETETYKIILSAARKASKKTISFQVLKSEVTEVLRNAPNKPGGTNYIKKKKTPKSSPRIEKDNFPEESD